MFDMVLKCFEWFCYVLIPLAPGTAEPIWTLPTTKLYKTNRWETWEVQRILATHHGFHHSPSCFQTGLVQTSSILVLDHPWFNSLVPCLTWFWMVLLCFDTPGLWHCWTHLNPPHNKTIQNQLMNLTHPSWFPSFPIMFSNRSGPNLFYFSTGPPLV